MRQPVLVPVDADEVLEGAGDPRLLVRLELREIDEDVGADGAGADEVLVLSPRMMGVDRVGRVVGSVVAAFAGVGRQLARSAEVVGDVSTGIPRDLASRDDDTVPL